MVNKKETERIRKATEKIYKIIEKANIRNDSAVCMLEGIKLDIFLNTPNFLVIDGRVGELNKLNKTKKKKISRRNQK